MVIAITAEPRPAQAFIDAGRTLAEVLGRASVQERWHAPSALDRMTVAALAGHTARAVVTVRHYLDEVAARPVTDEEAARQVDAAGYVIALLTTEDLDAPLHVGVRDRGAQEGSRGPEALATLLTETLDDMQNRVPPVAGTLIRVADGLVLRLHEYLVTRCIELVVHLDDLAVSLDEKIPIPEDAAQLAVQALAEIARRRHGTPAVIAQLARRERIGEPVTAL